MKKYVYFTVLLFQPLSQKVTLAQTSMMDLGDFITQESTLTSTINYTVGYGN